MKTDSSSLDLSSLDNKNAKVTFILNKLLQSNNVLTWKANIEKEILKDEYNKQIGGIVSNKSESDLIRQLLEKLGIQQALKLMIIDIYHEINQNSIENWNKQVANSNGIALLKPHQGDLYAITHARDKWFNFIRNQLDIYIKEQGWLSFVRPSQLQNSSPVYETTTIAPNTLAEEATSSLSFKTSNRAGSDAGITHYHFLCSSDGLLHNLQCIKSSNFDCVSGNVWGSIQLLLTTPSISTLRQKYIHLSPEFGQVGVDDSLLPDRSIFMNEKYRVGNLILSYRSVPMAQQYTKTGCPSALRPQIWQQALKQQIDANMTQYFQDLTEQVVHWEYITDNAYNIDLEQTMNHSEFFVFDELLNATMMAFTRDKYIHTSAFQVNEFVALKPKDILSGLSSSKCNSTSINSYVPPCGVVPFKGISMYLAPLAYLYTDPVQLYFVFREMYIRYWSKLNAIHVHSLTIAPLCKLFEELVSSTTPTTVFYLCNCDVKPLDIVFPWIQQAFVGVLKVSQVLLLWDRIIGSDSTEVIPILAAALFHFRSKELENKVNLEEARSVFDELEEINVIALIQEYMFLCDS